MSKCEGHKASATRALARARQLKSAVFTLVPLTVFHSLSVGNTAAPFLLYSVVLAFFHSISSKIRSGARCMLPDIVVTASNDERMVSTIFSLKNPVAARAFVGLPEIGFQVQFFCNYFSTFYHPFDVVPRAASHFPSR